MAKGKQGRGGPVRVSMSATVANDLEMFKKGVVAFAEEIGCPACFSGLDCTFESEREFSIGPKVNVARVKPPHERAATGLGKREVSVPVSTESSFDIDAILEKIDILGKRLGGHWENGGPAWCCSGFDVTFERETRISVPAY